MSNEIVLKNDRLEPKDQREAMELAKIAAMSKLFPVKTPEEAYVLLKTGSELGLSAMQSFRGIHMIDGKPTLSADLCVAVIKSSALCEYWRTVESTDKVATIETKRRGDPEPTRKTWTWQDATRAQLNSRANWVKYPAQMLRHRCAADLAREVYPDLLMGVYTPDELQEAHVESPTTQPAVISSLTVKDAGKQLAQAQRDGMQPAQLAVLFRNLHSQLDCEAIDLQVAMYLGLLRITENSTEVAELFGKWSFKLGKARVELRSPCLQETIDTYMAYAECDEEEARKALGLDDKPPTDPMEPSGKSKRKAKEAKSEAVVNDSQTDQQATVAWTSHIAHKSSLTEVQRSHAYHYHEWAHRTRLAPALHDVSVKRLMNLGISPEDADGFVAIAEQRAITKRAA